MSDTVWLIGKRSRLPQMAAAVEKLFWALNGDHRAANLSIKLSKSSGAYNNASINFRRTTAIPTLGRLFQQPRHLADSNATWGSRPLSSAKPTFGSALRLQRIEFQTGTRPPRAAHARGRGRKRAGPRNPDDGPARSENRFVPWFCSRHGSPEKESLPSPRPRWRESRFGTQGAPPPPACNYHSDAQLWPYS